MSCSGLEVDGSMPSVDTVFNWVSGIKRGYICQKCRWSKPMFTNIGIKFYGMVKRQVSSSKDSLKLMYGISLTCFLLVI